MRFVTVNPMSRFNTSLWNQFDDFWNDFEAPQNSWAADSHFETEEADDYYRVSVDAPGLRREDLKISLEDRLLTVSGERKRAAHRSEMKSQSTTSFKRIFTLPQNVLGEKIEAHYEDGVLELYLPKAETAKVRQIEIKNQGDGFFSKLLQSKKSETPEKQ